MARSRWSASVGIDGRHGPDYAHQEFDELGTFIWLDRYGHEPIKKNTKIQLMPAGKYFIETLSTAREYAFWNALTADLDEDIVGRSFAFSETYKDEFKFEVVYNFAEQILSPALQEELEYVNNNLHTPKGWKGSNLEYFKNLFSISGHFYVDRLLNSVMKSIMFAELPAIQRKEIDGKYSKLLIEVEKLEGLR